MITSIKIDKFRSFSIPFEIPLTPFTLLFGSNGSGKSSILEAIELCISGNSSRTYASGVGDTIEEIRTTGNREGLNIQLCDEQNKPICSFNDRGPNLAFPRLLRKFYKREAHHRTAQSLLATLFATHNLLTQDRIVRLLDADSKDDLDKITQEMVAGANIVERWDKFQRLGTAVTKAYHEVVENESHLRVDLENIESNIRKSYEAQERDLIQKSRDIYKMLMDISLKKVNDLKDDDLKSVLSWVQVIAVLIKESRLVIQGVRERAKDKYILNIDDIKYEIDIYKRDLSDTVSLSEEVKKSLEILSLKDSEVNNIYARKKVELRRQNELIDKFKVMLSNMYIIKEWRAELLADFYTQAIENERKVLKHELFQYDIVINLLNEYPSVKKINMALEGVKRLQNDYNEKKKNRDALESEVGKIEIRLKELNEEFSSLSQSKKSLITQYERLYALIESILSAKSQLSKCPTCGTQFTDRELLINKIKENITKLRKEEGTYPDIFRLIPEHEEKLRVLKENLKLLNELISNTSKTLNDRQQQIKEWHQSAVQIKDTLITLRFADIEDQDTTDLKQFCQYTKLIDISKKQQYIKNNINDIDFKLLQQWQGLRKETYANASDDLVKKLESIPELRKILNNADLLKAKVIETEHIMTQLIDNKENIQKDIDGYLIDTANLKGQIKVKQTQLNESLANKNELEKKIKELANLLSGANKINSLFERPLTVVNIEDLQKKLDNVSARNQGLEESLVSLMQIINNQRRNEEQKNKILTQMKCNYEKKRQVEKLYKGFIAVTPLEWRLRKEWEQYQLYINDLFLKLQTPPDFSEIKLHGEKLNFNLMAISRSSKEAKPANVLSSGQRTALAISIFWTMNLYGSHSPHIILMDEPIQQIDDINSLNFLDTLRWIADSGKRQIIISTASSRIAGLIRRKFSYLGEYYSEVVLERHLGLPIINIYDHAGQNMNSKMAAVHE